MSFVAHIQALIAEICGILTLFQVLIADSLGILAFRQVLISENFGILALFRALIADNLVFFNTLGKNKLHPRLEPMTCDITSCFKMIFIKHMNTFKNSHTSLVWWSMCSSKNSLTWP